MTIKILAKRTGLGNQIQMIPQITWLKKQGYDVYSDSDVYKELNILDTSDATCKENIVVYGYDWRKYFKEIGFSIRKKNFHGYTYRIRGKHLRKGLKTSLIFDNNISEIENNNRLYSKIFQQPVNETYPSIQRKYVPNRIILGFSDKPDKNPSKTFMTELLYELHFLGYNVQVVDYDFGYNYRSTPKISHLVNVLKSAEYYIGSDTGVGHLADYLGIPNIRIFGPTSHIKNGGVNTTVFRRGLQCSPCYDHGRVNCPYNYKCMSISTREIVEVFKKLSKHDTYSRNST